MAQSPDLVRKGFPVWEEQKQSETSASSVPTAAGHLLGEIHTKRQPTLQRERQSEGERRKEMNPPPAPQKNKQIIKSTLSINKSVYSTMYSQAVTHPSTNMAQCCLTSVIRRELVFSTWYGRRQRDADWSVFSKHREHSIFKKQPYFVRGKSHLLTRSTLQYDRLGLTILTRSIL